MTEHTFEPNEVLDLWFPQTGHETAIETHGAFWDERMQGGMDATIVDSFGPLTIAAARGELDHWAQTARGRLALLITLDQFPRSLWRDTPGAFAQDIKATRLALEGIANGHFAELMPWEQTFFIIAITHCEGPDHWDRLNAQWDVIATIEAAMPDVLAGMRGALRGQHERVMGIIATFARHPHRNAVLGRASTAAEEAYIATGDFPHVRKIADIAQTAD
jgi:uncharacterized protein (DUF924 family)